MITERQRQILNLIVSLYAKDHTPIGSKSLLDSIQASSATIRNEMADLEELGYLEQPHTSAGRIPSDKAYRLYVDQMMQRAALSDDEIKRQFASAHPYETWIEETQLVIEDLPEVPPAAPKKVSKMSPNPPNPPPPPNGESPPMS